MWGGWWRPHLPTWGVNGVCRMCVGKIIVKTPDPAPVQADLQANSPPSGVLQVPPGPVSPAATGQEELKRPKEGCLSAPFDDTGVVVLRGGRECSDDHDHDHRGPEHLRRLFFC